MLNKFFISLLTTSFFLNLSCAEAMESENFTYQVKNRHTLKRSNFEIIKNEIIKNNSVIHTTKYLRDEKGQRPKLVIDTYCNSIAPENHEGTLLYFHGGPNHQTSFELRKDFILSCLNKLNYRFLSVEISGSSAVSETLEDEGEKPNYVTQIGTIMSHLKEDGLYGSKPFVALSHSYGAFQLFNYLRFLQEELCPFNKILSIAGVYNTGSWFFEMITRWNLRDGQHEPHDILPSQALINNLEDMKKGQYHSVGYLQTYNNPVVNHELNQRLSPFFHTDKLPHIPYLFYIAVDDRNIHVSQTVALYQKLIKQGREVQLFIDNEANHNILGVYYAPAYFANGIMSAQENEIQQQKHIRAQDRLIQIMGNFIGGHREAINKYDFLGFPTPVCGLREINFYEPSVAQNIRFLDHYRPYRNWNKIHQTIQDPLEFFLIKGKHPLFIPVFQIDKAQTHIRNISANNEDEFINNNQEIDELLCSEFPRGVRNLARDKLALGALKFIPHHLVEKLQLVKSVYNINELSRSWFDGIREDFQEITRAAGIPYTEEEIFAEASHYQGNTGYLSNLSTNRVWRESGEFRLEPGKQEIEFCGAVDDRGWLYKVKSSTEEPSSVLGCLILNKWDK